jgi:RNA polymerase sigma-70 factor (ECF subfamily)
VERTSLQSSATRRRYNRTATGYGATLVADDHELLAELRQGDDKAFATLVDRHHSTMVRLARPFVSTSAVAEEVAQETWMAMLRGLSRFEARSSLKTWLFAILINQARKAGVREHRQVPLDPSSGSTVAASRFAADGAWATPPVPWTEEVEDRLTAEALAPPIRAAIDQLPPPQRLVVTLRDVEGLSATDACAILGVTEANQRVLLHRGRAAVRQRLERELGEA